MAHPAVAKFISFVRRIVAEREPPMAADGIIIPGSWNAQQGTVDVLLAKTAALDQTQDEGPLVHRNLQVLNPAYGMQAGPVGNERCVLIPCESGYRVLIEYWTDDSPQAPAGEFWYVHRDPNSGQINAMFKVTNDGPTTGDSLGALRGGCGLVNFTTTSGALDLKLDDTAQQAKMMAGSAYHLIDANAQKITHQASATIQHVLDGLNSKIQHTAGNVYTLLDANGQAISHVVGSGGKLALGDAIGTIGNAANAALAKTHSDTLLANVDTQFLTNASTLVTALNTANAFRLGFNVSSFIALLVSGFFSSTSRIAGSASVFLKL